MRSLEAPSSSPSRTPGTDPTEGQRDAEAVRTSSKRASRPTSMQSTACSDGGDKGAHIMQDSMVVQSSHPMPRKPRGRGKSARSAWIRFANDKTAAPQCLHSGDGADRPRPGRLAPFCRTTSHRTRTSRPPQQTKRGGSSRSRMGSVLGRSDRRRRTAPPPEQVLILPGDITSGDSHTCTGGALGALASGVEAPTTRRRLALGRLDEGPADRPRRLTAASRLDHGEGQDPQPPDASASRSRYRPSNRRDALVR
jgi:hypothetical protein